MYKFLLSFILLIVATYSNATHWYDLDEMQGKKVYLDLDSINIINEENA